ncbi:MAG: InlB B-repeat-containing protein [Clostridia bacterium]|nr:InlB B-repeat-containing protein [Clostridia bacterium]
MKRTIKSANNNDIKMLKSQGGVLKMKISRRKMVSLMLLFTILMAAIMPTIADAATVSRIGDKIVNTTTYETTSFPETEGGDPREHSSTVYVGEVKKDGDTVLTYLYSDDVARSSVIFDNLRKALSNPYSSMVPIITSEQTTSGMKELSTNSLNEIDLTGITSGWTDASNIATQIYNGTNTDIVNSNMYDVDSRFKTEIDNSTTERAALDHPIETNKRIISHIGTQNKDKVSFKMEDSQLVEVHDVDLYYLSEATTVIYTSVNVETTPIVTEYDLYVGNTRVTSANKDNVLGDGKVTYNPTTHTLNLNDATITTITSIQKPKDDLRSAMILSYEDDLIITGKATLTNDSAKQGIMAVGSNWNGNLTINADITANMEIWACGNLTFSGGTTACSTAIRTSSYLTVGSGVTKITARDIWQNNGYTIEEPLQITSGAIGQYGSNVVIEVPTQTSNTISTINISGLTQPTPGQSVPAVSVTTPGINMTGYNWWNGVSGNSVNTFESGNLYVLGVYFNVEGGYTLSDSYEVNCGVTPTGVNCDNNKIELSFLLPVEYTVHFMDGMTELSTQQVVKNGYATRPTTNPVKDTYRFVDWYADSTLTTKFNFATAKITEETSVYAKFVPTPKYPQYSENIVNSYDVTSNVVTLYVGDVAKNGTSEMKYLYTDGEVNTATLEEIRKILPADYNAILPTTAGQVAVSNKSGVTVNEEFKQAKSLASYVDPGFAYSVLDTSSSTTLYNQTEYDALVAATSTEVNAETIAETDNLAGWNERKTAWEVAEQAKIDADPEYMTVDFPEEYVKAFNDSTSYPTTSFFIADNQGTPYTGYIIKNSVVTRVDNYPIGRTIVKVVSTSANVTEDSTPCTVSFETYGGGTIPNQNLTVGQKATRPTTPSREKCTFVNWYANENLTTLFDFDQSIAGDTTIYAGYTKDAWVDNTVDESKATIISEVVVTDVANGEQRTQETYNQKVNTLFSSTAESEEIAPVITLAKTAAQNYMSGNGYINKSSTDSTSTGRVWDNRMYVTSDPVYSSTEKAMVRTHTASGTYGKEITYKTTFLADYERPKHTITFNPNGGEVSPTSKECYEGIALGELPTPTRRGYTFNGWFVNDYYGLGHKEAFEDSYFSRHVLRLAPAGSISNGLVKPGCVIVFDVTINNTVPIGADVNDNDLVSGTDFTIDGNRIYGSVTINSSHWNQWGTGTYGNYGFLDINCQDRISGYTINDFKVYKNQASTQEVTASSTMGNADMSVMAEWQLRNNTVKFDTKGGSDVASQTVTTGNKVTKPDNPTKADNGFGGWYVDTTLSTPFDFNTTIDDDTTIYAKWIPYHDAVLELHDGMNTSEIGDSAENELVDDVLTLRGLMKIEEDEVNGAKSVYTGDGKLLFTIDKDGKITYAEGIGYKDNIVCPLTDEEKAMLASKGLYINNVVLSLGFEYRILEGANQTHTTNKDGSLTVRANGDISKFVTLLVDRIEVSENDRTVISGSTIATLKKEFLELLSEGTHELTFVYTDGEVSTNFTLARVNTPVEALTQSGESAGIAVASTPAAPAQVQAKSPTTGDNIYLWIILLILSTGVFIGTGISLKKNK